MYHYISLRFSSACLLNAYFSITDIPAYSHITHDSKVQSLNIKTTFVPIPNRLVDVDSTEKQKVSANEALS